MKILYAASDREGASIQLLRFLQATSNKNYTIKIAAYNRFNNFSIDWNLESLKNIFAPDILSFNNDKLQTYYEQVKYFDPDLIISDLELYTSHIATLLNKRLWQVSPNLLHYGTPKKEKMAVGLFKSYPHLFNNLDLTQRVKNVIVNSEKNFVYSHFGDTNNFQLTDGFEWIRPYHVTGKISTPCKHHIMACSFRNNKSLIDYLKQYKDVVLFSTFVDEKYPSVILKDVYDWCEYECNLKNCNIFINQGHNDFMADAYYNGKHSIIMPNFQEQECITNALYSKHFKFGTVIYNNKFIDVDFLDHEVNYNPSINYLHEEIEKI